MCSLSVVSLGPSRRVRSQSCVLVCFSPTCENLGASCHRLFHLLQVTARRVLTRIVVDTTPLLLDSGDSCTSQDLRSAKTASLRVLFVKCFRCTSTLKRLFQDGDPCRVGIAMTDMSTGLYAAVSILASLVHRQQTSEGQLIDCNLLSTQARCVLNLQKNSPSCSHTTKRAHRRQRLETTVVIRWQR